jgi:hypothetical protein
MPVTAFTHRHWEAVSFVKVIHKYGMYPNINSKMVAVGDLCYNTKYAIPKNEIWQTDRLGFRNDKFIKNPDVLLIGDSFFAGCSLSQESTLVNKLIAKSNTNFKFYNQAPSSLAAFDKFYKLGELNKPKIIVFGMVEREVPDIFEEFGTGKNSILKNKLQEIVSVGNLNVFVDRILKQNSLEWIKSKLRNNKGWGIKSSDESNMFFAFGKNQNHSQDRLKLTIDRLVEYKKYCDKIGVKFVFVPMPDKESVYFEKVPFNVQPHYLYQLDSLLRIENIETINTIELYNNYRKSSVKLLYHLDDTHWNSTATELVATELMKKINKDL